MKVNELVDAINESTKIGISEETLDGKTIFIDGVTVKKQLKHQDDWMNKEVVNVYTNEKDNVNIHAIMIVYMKEPF